MTQDFKPEPGWLRAITALSHGLNVIAAVVAAITVAIMVAIILVEIVLRMFSTSTFMTDVVVSNGVSIATFLVLAYALETSAMIRVTLALKGMGHWLRTAFEYLVVMSSAALVGWLLYYVFDIFWKSFTRGTMSVHMHSFPKWYIDIVPVIGLSLLFLQLVVRFLRLVAVGYTPEKEVEI